MGTDNRKKRSTLNSLGLHLDLDADGDDNVFMEDTGFLGLNTQRSGLSFHRPHGHSGLLGQGQSFDSATSCIPATPPPTGFVSRFRHKRSAFFYLDGVKYTIGNVIQSEPSTSQASSRCTVSTQ